MNRKAHYAKHFFWKQSKDDKKQIEKQEGWNVYDYVDKFLPAFGFYSYRDSSCEESAEFQVIQKNGRFVQIIGGLHDPKTTEKIFRWTLDSLKYLRWDCLFALEN